MTFELPELPYERDALEPYISEETLEYHYGKHHKAYVDKLNKLIEGTPFENKSVVEIIQQSDGAIFDNAAQVWNHTFYWHCMSAQKERQPQGQLLDKLKGEFGSLDEFKKRFAEAAVANFGSGWTWLVKNANGTLSIVNTDDADTPIRTKGNPILTCDVWEHAYYIDYRNARAKYVDAFWNVVNWRFVEENYDRESQTLNLQAA
ncbi:MAG TPA: Fe-Mn family superoxide dismutase [Gammaproteobacteria bacterium]